MLEINKQNSAEDDLINIWLYSFEQWDESTADKYLDLLNRAIEKLRLHPRSGMDCSEIREGYRRLIVQHHRIYYYLTSASIEVVRVLHQRTDEERQFQVLPRNTR